LGCLIEKGRIGTIYFGHRSLHAFLVTKHLIAKDFDGALRKDKRVVIATTTGALQTNPSWAERCN
jgi:hypothetical protein